MSGCELPPCPPCPPPSPPVCPQTCAPPPPLPPCRIKPLMRGLHWKQTASIITQALVASAFIGICYSTFVTRPRIRAYEEFNLKAEPDIWEDEMARKGLFQSVPKQALQGEFKRHKMD